MQPAPFHSVLRRATTCRATTCRATATPSFAPSPVHLRRCAESRRSWATALLVALMALPAAVSCGARELDMSTKTGNPPVIDRTRVRIVGAAGDVVVSGERGAVDTAAGVQAVAKLKNRSNDASASAAVNEDGSFEVRVEGTLEDEYELTITARGTSDSTTISLAVSDTTDSLGRGDGALTCLERTGTPVSEGATMGPQPVCGMLQSEALCRAAELVASASLECEDEDDCVVASRTPNCADSYGGGVAVSTKGASELSVGLASIDETICQDFDEQGCTYYASGGPLHPKTVARCEAGACVGKLIQYGFECSNAVLYGNTATCDDYETEARCQRDEMLADLNNACTRDDECTVFEAAPTCAERDCSHRFVVAAASVAEAEAGMTAINGGSCSQADATQCEYPGQPCISLPLNPRCIAGACVNVPAE